MKKFFAAIILMAALIGLASCGRRQGANTYKINFDTNGGNAISAMEVNWDSVPTFPTPTRTGYTFDGWYLDKKLTNKVAKDAVFTDDITVYAKWIINQYTITYMFNSSTVYMTKEADYNSTVTVDNPTSTNFTFVGWYTDSAFENKFNNKVPGNDLTVYAKWSPNSITITYDGNGAPNYQKMENQTLIWGENLTLSSNIFTRSGYSFGGWSKVKDGELVYQDKETLTSIASSEDITLYAIWNPLSYECTMRNFIDGFRDDQFASETVTIGKSTCPNFHHT